MSVATTGTRLHLLGGFRLYVADELVSLPWHVQRLIGRLATVRPQLRSSLATHLWADLPQERAQAALRNALWRIRQLDADIVRSHGEMLELDAALPVDLREARTLACALLAGGEPAQNLVLRNAAPVDNELGFEPVTLLAEDLLPEWDEDWVLIERESQRQLRIHALESLADALATEGNTVAAIQVALLAVAAEPLRESAQAVLIRTHLLERNLSEAIRQFEAYRTLLADELDLEPSEALSALVRRETRAPSTAA